MEEEARHKEQEDKLVQEKALAREEYAERHARKAAKLLKAAQLGKVVAPPPTFDEQKLFVGGLTWDDIQKKYKVTDPAKRKEIIAVRLKHLWTLFESFGTVLEKKDFVASKQHCFIIYEDTASLEKALSTLSSFEERKRLTLEIRQKIVAAIGKDAAVYAPSSHFYVRKVASAVAAATGKRKKKPKVVAVASSSPPKEPVKV